MLGPNILKIPIPPCTYPTSAEGINPPFSTAHWSATNDDDCAAHAIVMVPHGHSVIVVARMGRLPRGTYLNPGTDIMLVPAQGDTGVQP